MPTLDHTMRQVLALRREAGSTGAAQARDLVAAHLEALGYRVERQRFAFLPGSLNGFPVFGAGLGGLGLLQLPLLTSGAAPSWAALLVLVTGLTLLAVVAVGIGLGWLALGESREDENLVATRGDAPVRRWIVAHLDTKAQGQSMAGRLVAVWVIGLAIAVLAALASARLGGPLALPPTAVGGAVAVLAGALAGRGRLRGESQGARDNGTGVAGALAAADAPGGAGILITGAEEFGLVGARVFVRQSGDRLHGAVVLNLDTIDQEGALAIVSHDGPGASLARAEAPRLAALGLGARLRRLPVGILTDSLPFARAGVSSVTIGRLTWRTLRTIHTPRDTPEGLSLETAIRVGRALATN